MIRLNVMTDGRRDYIGRTLASAREQLSGLVTERVIHDDSGDEDHRAWLRASFPDFEVIGSGPRRGFGGAMINLWRDTAERSQAPWVFHLEDDFLFTRPLNLTAMTDLLHRQPHLAQMALRRQAWGVEVEVGGFMEQNPGCYSEHADDVDTWVEHRLFFTTNPAMYRRQLIDVGWPEGLNSEGRFGFVLKDRGLPWGVAGDDVRFGFYGSMEGGRDSVWHIGEHRAGTGY